MKIIMEPEVTVRRGGKVEVGNVYNNPHGNPHYKIVVSIVERDGNKPWNNVIMLHVDATGSIVGCVRQPITYVSEHQDLIGRVKQMPSMKIEWLKKGEK